MASNPLHHDQPTYLYILRMYMKMLDAASTLTMRPDAGVQSTMWKEFLEDIGVGYDRCNRLEVQDAQRFMIACIRHGIPT
jgi:hypothetical protein